MEKYGRNSDLAKFIIGQSDSYNAMFKAVEIFACSRKSSLDFVDNDFRTGFITLEDIFCVITEKVVIKDSTVNFDAVIQAQFSMKKRYRGDYDDSTESLLFRLRCVMVITDKLSNFKINSVDKYSKEQRIKELFGATANFVPIISKEEFDNEATRFLEKWYPEALITPMPIPIEEIAQNRIGLKIVRDKKLSENFSVFGQICFSKGTVKVYDEVSRMYMEITVDFPTIFIDPDTFFLRNLGCANNTIAHELFHWERHRIYAIIHGILNGQQTIACRCPTSPKDNSIRETLYKDEDWMEWQANGIAPKVLMPKRTAELKIKELIDKYNYEPSNSGCFETLKVIIDEFAAFFKVSKQSAKIRLIELGYKEAAEVYNYEPEFAYPSNEISLQEAIYEYENNQAFKTVIDLNLFRYVEGYFVINDEKYYAENEQGQSYLTDYAKENIFDCALLFTYNLVELYEYGKNSGVLLRPQARFGNVARYEQNVNNDTIIDIALEAARLKQQFEASEELGIHQTAAQMICTLMDKKGWKGYHFEQKTHLSKDYFSKLYKQPNKQLELPCVIAICVGLALSQSVSMEIIAKAGYSLVPANKEHAAYERLLSPIFSGQSIDTCNDFLEECERQGGIKIRKLGSYQHGER